MYFHPVKNPAPPVNSPERIVILDVLRGFAILGIFLANSSNFSLYMFMEEEAREQLSTAPFDRLLDFLLVTFVEGKFYSLFSLLFGIGFTIILERTALRGKSPLLIFYRRLTVLAMLGLGHLFLLWEGDILLLYAVIGMVLPLFTGLTSRTLIIVSVFLVFSPMFFDLAKVLSNNSWNLSNRLEALALEVDAASGITEQNFRTYLADHNTYTSILNWCRGAFYWRYEYIVESNRIPKVLAMFLVGLVAGRKLKAAPPESYAPGLIYIRKWGFLIGLPASLLYAWFHFDQVHLPEVTGLADTLFYAVSVIPLSLAYTATIIIHWNKHSSTSWLKIFAPVGKMALSNYIFQTFAGIFIYYGIGLSLATKSGPAVYLPIALAVFLFQVAFSTLWLKYFYYGPLEWIWRQLTYGKILPIIKQK